MATLSAAIGKSLLAKMPARFASKFEVDEAQVSEFLKEFLAEQLGAPGKTARATGPKGTNGKGRISGYILFSNETRDSVKESNPDLKFTEIGRELGRLWKEMTEDERAEFKQRADAQNAENGLPTPTPGAAKAAGASAPKRQRNPKAEAADDAPAEPTLTRHAPTKSWAITGTEWVVKSRQDKTVVGKLKNDKVVELSAADRKKCQSKGYTC